MTIKEIEAFFKNADQVDLIFDKYQDAFDRLTVYEDSLRSGGLDTPHEIDEAMQELVALYSMFNVAARIAETQKSISEARTYHDEKMQADRNNVKATEKYLEVLSKIGSANFRRVFNIFEAYRDSCDRIISVLQSSLKAIEKDRNNHG